jgi:protein-tyrosine phosphatase
MLQEQLRITHIVNAAKEVINRCDKVKYLNIDIADEVTEKIQDHFDEVYDFIKDEWDNENSRILVHCA